MQSYGTPEAVAAPRQSENDVDLPIPLHHARAEEIAKIATIDATYHSGRIIASLTLPLVERTAYDLYQLHSVAIPQKTTLQGLRPTAYVVSEYEHVAVSKDQQKYLKLTRQQLHGCLDTHYGYICSPRGIIFNTASQKECGIEMLINPSKNALSLCTVIMKSDPSTQWVYLNTDGTWLYSTTASETLRISCSGEIYQVATLTGMGILRLAEGCSARTTQVILTPCSTRTSNTQYIYNPDLSLDVQDLYPEFKTLNSTDDSPNEIFDQATLIQKHPWEQRKESLHTIMSRMHEIGQHQRSTAFTHTLIYSGIAFQLVLVLVIGLVCVFRLRGCHRRHGVFPVRKAPALNLETALNTTPEPPKMRSTIRASFKSIMNPKPFIPSAKID